MIRKASGLWIPGSHKSAPRNDNLGGSQSMEKASHGSQAKSGPDGASFKGRYEVVDEPVSLDAEESLRRNTGHARRPSPEQRTLRRDRRRHDVLAEALTQERTHVAELINQPEILRGLGHPIFPGKHGIFRAREPFAPALADKPDEQAVDVLLDRLEARHVVLILGEERVQRRFVLARRVDAPFDAELLDRFRKPEGRADHADRSHDRSRVDRKSVV